MYDVTSAVEPRDATGSGSVADPGRGMKEEVKEDPSPQSTERSHKAEPIKHRAEPQSGAHKAQSGAPAITDSLIRGSSASTGCAARNGCNE